MEVLRVVQLRERPFSLLVEVLGTALQESLQPQGVRGLDLVRLRAISGDTSGDEIPELWLNICLVCEVFVQILTTGVGTLAFIWATVVLLGGFSASLHQADFWVITGIVFIQATKVVGLNSNTEAIFLAQVPPAFLELWQWGPRKPLTGDASGRRHALYMVLVGAGNVISLMAFLTLLLPLLPLVAAYSCIGLSMFRLIIITQQYGDSAGGSNSSVLRALIFFYALVLAQGGLFLIWLNNLRYRLEARDQVCSKYQFEDKDKKQLIDKYIDRTRSSCIRAGVLNTINRKLVTFAVDLLQSEYSQDRISGVLVLHTLTSKDAHEAHRARAVAHIQSSADCIPRMLALLSSKGDIDEKYKVHIAQIVALLASDLRLSDIDGATDSISSLIDPYLTKISTANSVNNAQQTTTGVGNDQLGINQTSTMANRINKGQQITIDFGNDQQGTNPPDNPNGEKSKPLIIHGLMILAKLAGNPDNCSKIYSTRGLFSKITAPISNKMYTVFSHDDTAIEITEQSLQVVSKLVKRTDEINRKILQEIRSNGFEESSIRPILTYDQGYNKLKVPAIKILTKLALANTTRDTIADEAMVNFISSLMELFFNDLNESRLRKTAGKALALLATASRSYCARIMNGNTGAAHSVVRHLSNMLSDRSNKSYRTAIAQLLKQFCIDCSDDERERLVAAKEILHEVLKVICNEVDANQSDLPQHNRSRAQLVLQICLPCIDTSSFPSRRNQGPSPYLGDNGHNQRPPSPPATRRNQRESNINTKQNQTLGSRNQRREGQNQGEAQGILSGALQVLSRLVNLPGTYNADRHNRNVQDQPAAAPIKPGRRKALVAFLGLAVHMCEKLINASEFDAAVLQIPLSQAEFVVKLKEIIEMCIKDSVGPSKGKGPSVDYLVMIKTVTKLCTWVMQSNQGYVTHFKDTEIDKKLKDAVEAMKGLELAVLLTCSEDEVTNYETLSSIVEVATRLIQPQRPAS